MLSLAVVSVAGCAQVLLTVRDQRRDRRPSHRSRHDADPLRQHHLAPGNVYVLDPDSTESVSVANPRGWG